MRGKYERRFFRVIRKTPEIITDHHYSHESLFSLSILIGPLQPPSSKESKAGAYEERRGGFGDGIVYVNEHKLPDGDYTQRVDPEIIDGRIHPRDNLGPVVVPAHSFFCVR